MKIKTLATTLLLSSSLLTTSMVQAADYILDTKGMHAFVQFRVQHLGYSWLYGRFNEFDGKFSYNEKAPEKATVSVTINTASVDSNHAERDKHLRSDDFLNVEKHPKATFESTSYKPNGDGTATLEGNLTLNGVTKPLSLAVSEIGAGDDPWGGYRRGFEATTSFKMADFDITKNLGPASTDVEMTLSIEGIRQ
ncbi:MAG: Polyisoprenoid-binding protein YceI [uncultured Thiotrichaceae bacterium]|uniref:Polyisoprenoid-binding protein YceI n=1 Tax=uncultured Thiotrichaceae bacterium TaxID=298394 RepID=A0A6S6ULC7_9GAMM|nr:MAG: Polyisoprenoid-binding protein YceI [uncultured Thiotrichaceae bacterium]